MFFLEDTWYLSQYIYNLPKITCTFIYIYNICTYIHNHNILKSYIYNLTTYLPTHYTYQGWEKPGFFRKNPAQWVFSGFIKFFRAFLGFFGFFQCLIT